MPDDLHLSDFQPQPRLVTKTTLIDDPRYPVIDAHNHLRVSGFGDWHTRPVSELLALQEVP